MSLLVLVLLLVSADAFLPRSCVKIDAQNRSCRIVQWRPMQRHRVWSVPQVGSLPLPTKANIELHAVKTLVESAMKSVTVASEEDEQILTEAVADGWEASVFPALDAISGLRRRQSLKEIYFHVLSLCVNQKMDLLQMATFGRVAGLIYDRLRSLSSGRDWIDWNVEALSSIVLSPRTDKEMSDFNVGTRQLEYGESPPPAQPQLSSLFRGQQFLALLTPFFSSSDHHDEEMDELLTRLQERLELKVSGSSPRDWDHSRIESLRENAFDLFLSRICLKLSDNDVNVAEEYRSGQLAASISRILRTAFCVDPQSAAEWSLTNRLSVAWSRRLSESLGLSARSLAAIPQLNEEDANCAACLETFCGSSARRARQAAERLGDECLAASLSLLITQHSIEGVLELPKETVSSARHGDGDDEYDDDENLGLCNRRQQQRSLPDSIAHANRQRVKSVIEPLTNCFNITAVRRSLPVDARQVFKDLSLSHPILFREHPDVFATILLAESLRRDMEIEFGGTPIAYRSNKKQQSESEIHGVLSTSPIAPDETLDRLNQRDLQQDRRIEVTPELVFAGALQTFFTQTLLSLAGEEKSGIVPHPYDRKRFLHGLLSMVALDELLAADEPSQLATDALVQSLALIFAHCLLRGITPQPLIEEWAIFKQVVTIQLRLMDDNLDDLAREAFEKAISMAMHDLRALDPLPQTNILPLLASGLHVKESPAKNGKSMNISLFSSRRELARHAEDVAALWFAPLAQISVPSAKIHTRELCLADFDEAVRDSLLRAELLSISAAARRVESIQLRREQSMTVLTPDEAQERALHIAGLVLFTILEHAITEEDVEQRTDILDLIAQKIDQLFAHPILAHECIANQDNVAAESHGRISERSLALPLQLVLCECAHEPQQLISIIRLLESVQSRLQGQIDEGIPHNARSKSGSGWAPREHPSPLSNQRLQHCIGLLSEIQDFLLQGMSSLDQLQELLS